MRYHRWIYPCRAYVPQHIVYDGGPTACELDAGHHGWHEINVRDGRGNRIKTLRWDEWNEE